MTISQLISSLSVAIRVVFRTLSLILVLVFVSFNAFAQAPANDACDAAEVIDLAGGYGVGSYYSSTTVITNATAQPGEHFDASLRVAGLNEKTVWFKFVLPTARGCSLTLQRPTPTQFPSNSAGFCVYRANACMPGQAEQDSGILIPQAITGVSYNACMLPGVYYVQICAKTPARGEIKVEIKLFDTRPSLPALPNDKSTQAYPFGTMVPKTCYSHTVGLGCFSMDNATELWPTAGAFYTQSAWYTFRTPAKFDQFQLLLGSGTAATMPAYYRLYQGQGPVGSLTVADGPAWVPALTNSNYWMVKNWFCGQLLPDQNYTLQIVWHKTINYNATIQIGTYGGGQTIAPLPTAGTLPTSHKLGLLTSGVAVNASDTLGCNGQVKFNPCGVVQPANGIVVGTDTFKVASWYSFELPFTAHLNISASNLLYGNTLLRVFKGDAPTGCGTLNLTTDLYNTTKNNALDLDCVPPGKYLAQVAYKVYRGATTGTNCFGGYLGQQFTLTTRATQRPNANQFSLANPLGGRHRDGKWRCGVEAKHTLYLCRRHFRLCQYSTASSATMLYGKQPAK